MAYDAQNVKPFQKQLKDKPITRDNGKPIRYNAVRYILSNWAYIKEYKYSDITVENGIPAIIEKSVFDVAQNEMKKTPKLLHIIP